jgi:hypothetical protein
MKEHRGIGILLLGAAAIVALTGAGVWWALRPPPPTPCFLIFHWIPNPATDSLKVEGVSEEMDPRLLGVIRNAVSGELRLVCSLPSTALPRPQSAALLLVDSLEKSRTLPLFDRREAVYVQAGTGYTFHPGVGPPPTDSITLSPGKGGMQFLRSSGGAGCSGVVQMRWW